MANYKKDVQCYQIAAMADCGGGIFATTVANL
jgi:hypothetical protein